MTNQKLLMQLLIGLSNMEELNSLKVDDSIYKEIESVSRDVFPSASEEDPAFGY